MSASLGCEFEGRLSLTGREVLPDEMLTDQPRN
jgi:hypothetical protein